MSKAGEKGHCIVMQDFIKISKYAGMRNDLAQAGGGNTSVKLDEEIMLVKSSGIQLADVNDKTGYSKVNYRQITDYFAQHIGTMPTDADAEEKVFTEEAGKELLQHAHIEGGRASIETFLHAVTGKYTLHSHPMLVNILTARKDGREILHELFPQSIWIPYRKPGAALAETYYRLFKERRSQGPDGEIIFLANHGLVVSGENGDFVIEKTEQVLSKIVDHLHIEELQEENRRYAEATALYRTIQQIDVLSGQIVYVSENKYLSEEFAGKYLIDEGNWEHAFCPDCVVYGNKKLLHLPKQYTKQDILDFIGKYGAPVLVYREGQVYILAESVKKAQEIENVMSFAARVQYYNIGQEMNYLSDTQEDELLNWDSEKYRRSL